MQAHAANRIAAWRMMPEAREVITWSRKTAQKPQNHSY